jgi:hypothetical protein
VGLEPTSTNDPYPLDNPSVFTKIAQLGGRGGPRVAAAQEQSRQARLAGRSRPMMLDADTTQQQRPDPRGLGILARSLFRQMRAQGYSPEQIIGLSAELIQLVREDLAQAQPAE